MPERTIVVSLPSLPADLLLVPAHPGEPGRVRIEPRVDDTGVPVLVAFTSTRRLVDALGQHQPWVAVPGERLPVLAEAAGLAAVLVDPEVPTGAPGWTAADLEGLEDTRG